MDQKDQLKDQLLENSLTVVDEDIEEESSLEPSLSAKFPNDILKVIFGFLDGDTWRKVAQVNRAWNAIIEPFLPVRLAEYYQIKIPQALNDGYLLKTLCEIIEPLALDAQRAIIDPFSSETQQKLFFQQWMQDVFVEVVDGSESLLDFLIRMSQEFRQAGEQNQYNRSDYEARIAYLDKELAYAPQHITFLFNRAHIERFLQLYDRQKNCVIKNTIDADDYLFLAQCLHRATRLEGFLTTLVLFWKIKRDILESPSKIITSTKWATLLLGDGLVTLHTRFRVSLSLLSDIFSSLKPNEDQPPFTLEEAEFLFRKLRSADVLNWIKMEFAKLNFYEIKDLLLARLPYFLALLSMGSLASDTALIYCFKRAPLDGSEFFGQLVEIPEVILRLQASLFLHRLFVSSLFSNQEKSGLASIILNRPTVVCALAESTILFLMRYLRFARLDDSYDLNEIFATLASTNKLTSTLLIKLAQFSPPDDPGQYALSILETESAWVLLLQDTACATEIAKIAINSQHKSTIIFELALYFKGEKSRVHAHWQVLAQQLSDQDLMEMGIKFLFATNFFGFLDCIFSIDRMTNTLFVLLIQSEKNRFVSYALSIIDRLDRRKWLAQNLPIAFQITQCTLVSNQEVGQFVIAFSPVIQQFSALQLAELWCTAQPKHKQAIQDFITLNHWMMIWVRLNRAVSICVPIIIENKSLLEMQLINRLTHEASAQSLIDGLFQHHAMHQIQPWCRTYPNLLIRLQQPDIYRYIWQRCLSLLTQSHDAALSQDALGMLELLVFSPVPTEFSYDQQKKLLNPYTSLEIYTFCLQLAQKAGAVSRATQALFYPVCLPALEISELQQLKQELLAQGSRLFFPINDVEKVLSTKVQQGGTGPDQGFWLDALTTRELTAGLLLLLAGAGCFIAGLLLGWMILTGVGVIPLVIGAGILLTPVGSTLWHRRIPPTQEPDHTIERKGDHWPTTSPTFVPPTLALVPLPTHHDAPLDSSKPSASQNTSQKQSLLGTTEFNPTLN